MELYRASISTQTFRHLRTFYRSLVFNYFLPVFKDTAYLELFCVLLFTLSLSLSLSSFDVVFSYYSTGLENRLTRAVARKDDVGR